MVPEDYVHRIGRTGRAGAEGMAISLVCVDEGPLLHGIERLLRRVIAVEIVPGFEPDRSIAPEPIRLRSAEHRGMAARPRGGTPARDTSGWLGRRARSRAVGPTTGVGTRPPGAPCRVRSTRHRAPSTLRARATGVTTRLPDTRCARGSRPCRASGSRPCRASGSRPTDGPPRRRDPGPEIAFPQVAGLGRRPLDQVGFDAGPSMVRALPADGRIVLSWPSSQRTR